ncbi:MAG TPA: HEPN domain-containing protein [Pseudolabrys sp.]|nr:HEPN domain-containing protein [Pseudolabrys sp.]
MPLSAVETEIALLQKFKKNQIDLLRNGVRIEGVTGRSIVELVKEACVARVRLSNGFLTSARRLLSLRPMLHRDAISRSYYAMYHAGRAVAFFANQGDDYEPHDKLAGGLPPDFPDVERWRNALKDARLLRNEADYEPFPQGNAGFRRTSSQMMRVAVEFTTECTTYLRGKGCGL